MTEDGNDNPIVIYGASGHGKVIADIVTKSGGTVLAFFDDRESIHNTTFCGSPIWGGAEALRKAALNRSFSVIIGIGDNRGRYKISRLLQGENLRIGTAIHPSAQVGGDVVIGEGTVVMAGCVINPGARIGKHCIVNTAATIDHDCVIGDYVHLSPGAHLGGTVRVGDFTWIGLGASVINNMNIGENTIVGAGSVVIRDVASGVVVVGNPAAFLRNIQ